MCSLQLMHCTQVQHVTLLTHVLREIQLERFVFHCVMPMFAQ